MKAIFILSKDEINEKKFFNKPENSVQIFKICLDIYDLRFNSFFLYNSIETSKVQHNMFPIYFS